MSIHKHFDPPTDLSLLKHYMAGYEAGLKDAGNLYVGFVTEGQSEINEAVENLRTEMTKKFPQLFSKESP